MSTRTRLVFAAVVLCVVVAAAFVAWRSLRSKDEFSDRLIARIGPDVTQVAIADASNAAYVTTNDGKCIVIENGKPREAFDEIKGLVYAQGPKDAPPRLVYAGRRHGQWHVIDDGVVGPPFDNIVYIGAGKTIAYTAVQGSRQVLLEDGKKAEEADEIRFATTEQGRVAYAARNGSDWYVVFRGARQGPYKSLDRFTVNRAGDAIAVVADGRIMRGATASPLTGELVEFKFTDDDHHFVYTLSNPDSGTTTFVDGKPLDGVKGRPVLTDDGRMFGYREDEIGRSRLVPRAGSPDPWVPGRLSDVVRSADGHHVAYRFSGGNGLVADGRVFDLPRSASSTDSAPRYSSRNQLVHLVSQPTGALLIAGDVARTLEGFEPLTGAIVSDAGDRVAFGARRGDELWWKSVVLDHGEGWFPLADSARRWSALWRRLPTGKGIELAPDGAILVNGTAAGVTLPPLPVEVALPAIDAPLVIAPLLAGPGHLALLFPTGLHPGAFVVDTARKTGVQVTARFAVPMAVWSPTKTSVALLTSALPSRRDSQLEIWSSSGEPTVALPVAAGLEAREYDKVRRHSIVWRDDNRLEAVVEVHSLIEPGDASGRPFRITYDVAAQSMRASALDASDGAADILERYYRAGLAGDLDASLGMLAEADRSRIDPQEIQMTRLMMVPLAKAAAKGSRFTLRRLVVEATRARAQVEVEKPDFSREPAVRVAASGLNDLMMRLMFSNSSTPSDADKKQMQRTVDEMAAAIRSATDMATTRNITTCELQRDGSRWVVTKSCGDLWSFR